MTGLFVSITFGQEEQMNTSIRSPFLLNWPRPIHQRTSLSLTSAHPSLMSFLNKPMTNSLHITLSTTPSNSRTPLFLKLLKYTHSIRQRRKPARHSSMNTRKRDVFYLRNPHRPLHFSSCLRRTELYDRARTIDISTPTPFATGILSPSSLS